MVPNTGYQGSGFTEPLRLSFENNMKVLPQQDEPEAQHDAEAGGEEVKEEVVESDGAESDVADHDAESLDGAHEEDL